MTERGKTTPHFDTKLQNNAFQTTWICCKVLLCCCYQSNHAYPQCAVMFRVSTMSTRDQCSAVTALAHTVTRVSPCTRAPVNIATTYACTALNQTAFIQVKMSQLWRGFLSFVFFVLFLFLFFVCLFVCLFCCCCCCCCFCFVLIESKHLAQWRDL